MCEGFCSETCEDVSEQKSLKHLLHQVLSLHDPSSGNRKWSYAIKLVANVVFRVCTVSMVGNSHRIPKTNVYVLVVRMLSSMK